MKMSGVLSVEANRPERFRQRGIELLDLEPNHFAYLGTRERVLAMHLGAMTELEPTWVDQLKKAYPLPSLVNGVWKAAGGAIISEREAIRQVSYRVTDVEMYLARALSNVQFSRLLDSYVGPGTSGDLEAQLAAERLRHYRALLHN